MWDLEAGLSTNQYPAYNGHMSEFQRFVQKRKKCEQSGSDSRQNCQMGGQMESGVAGVGRQIGGWAGDGTQVRRWVVIGIMRLQAQSDRMLSLGDEWNMYRVCPKKEI